MRKTFIILFLSLGGFMSAQNSIGITAIEANGESIVLLPNPIFNDNEIIIPLIEGKPVVPVKGESSNIQLSNNKPDFIFRFVTKQDSIESKAEAKVIKNIPFAHAKKASDFELVKLYKQEGYRGVRINRYEAEKGIILTDEDLIPFKESVINDCTFKVTLEKPLEQGEYTFKFKGEIPECDTYFYAFTIK